ncbi:ABC transporter ATP-binding protein [Eggerthella lenta]|uniref:ABC transporter ATP-binding protein n=3 Tax=Eggerthella lenta TaxID=84112 RepID=UPI00189B845B|nr:ABC transporter ATP-binding protein [Eggerthella lenta]MDB1805181.1 ABC transporter ATP-binding protein [Eggerthella lenta]
MSVQADVALSFERAGFTYAGAREPALADVSLSVPAGQCVVLTGGSGCGKTTLTRLANGLIPVSYDGELTGSVRIAGKDAGSWEMDALCRRVGSVFQNPRSQFFNLDTTSEVAFGCENLGLSRAEMHRRVDGAFSLLGIEHLRDRDLRALSGGQRQMVAIASVCAMGPDVLVLDEPTASLDVGAMLQLAGAVARLKAAGKTVLVAEHRLWWLAGIADRVVVMRGGRVVCDADAAAFARIGEDERVRLGLRAWDLARVSPARCGDGSAAPGVRAADEALALDAVGLEAGYGREAPVLRGAGLRLDAGTVTALVGRNGAGKTTLSRCLVGLHRERAGSVRFRGAEPRCRVRPEHAYLVMQETGYQLFSDTVRGELLGALAHGGLRPAPDGADGQADRALARFGLEDIAERHPLSLSGGQRQRLAIAVGILQGARVLVLDEPTSGLDFGTMGRVADEVRRARDAGACIVVVTHDYEFVCAACDQVAVLEDGVVSDVLPVRGEALGRIRRAIGIDGRARPL